MKSNRYRKQKAKWLYCKFYCRRAREFEKRKMKEVTINHERTNGKKEIKEGELE